MKGILNVMKGRLFSHVTRLHQQNVIVGCTGARCAALPNVFGFRQTGNDTNHFVGLGFPLAAAIATLAATSGTKLANCADDDATSSTQTAKPTNICIAAQKVLRLSRGRMRVPLDELGPSTWNRFSKQSLNGKHMMQLGERILRVEGFATYRYVAGWCHEPNPADPKEVWRHATANARLDPLLPEYHKKTLKGVFAKSHLVALLQCVKAGKKRLPNEAQTMCVPEGPDWDELRDVMRFGIWMEVFDYKDVRDNFQAFEWLMASDNFDSAFALAEDELSVIDRISHSMKHTVPKPGIQLWDAILTEIRPLNGNRWSDNDLIRFCNFAKTTNCEKIMPFLKSFNKLMADMGNFHVHSKFYDSVASLSPRHQMLRLALCCWQISSDPELECKEASGQLIANAVEKRHFDILRACHDNVLLQFDDCCKQVFQKYWTDFESQCAWPDSDLLSAVGGFLVRLAKCITKPKLVLPTEDGQKERTAALTEIEKKLRAALSHGDRQGLLPSPVLHVVDTPSEAIAGGVKRKATLDPAPVVMFDGEGALVRDVGMRARELGLTTGANVQLIKKSKGIDAGLLGVVDSIQNDCITVKMCDSGIVQTFALGVLKMIEAPRPSEPADEEKEKAEEAERKKARLAAVPEGFAWSPVGPDTSKCILGRLVQGWLYHLHCKCSPAHDLLRFTLPSERGSNGHRIYALRDISAKSLFMVPFTDVVIAADSYAAPGAETTNGFPINVQIEGDPTEFTYYLQKPSWSSRGPGYKEGVDQQPAVLVAFWWANAMKQPQHERDLGSKGACCIAIAESVAPLTCHGRSIGGTLHPSLRKANQTAKVRITFPYLTNSANLAAGEELAGL